MPTLYLATCHNQPYALGHDRAEALARAEVRLRAECADMADRTRKAGLTALAASDATMDLSDIDTEPIGLVGDTGRLRAVLGEMWDVEEVDAELAALGMLAAA